MMPSDSFMRHDFLKTQVDCLFYLVLYVDQPPAIDCQGMIRMLPQR